jgi:hypothetical protein
VISLCRDSSTTNGQPPTARISSSQGFESRLAVQLEPSSLATCRPCRPADAVVADNAPVGQNARFGASGITELRTNRELNDHKSIAVWRGALREAGADATYISLVQSQVKQDPYSVSGLGQIGKS